MSKQAYLAEKYMSGAKAEAILSRVGSKKKKRKADPSSSGTTTAMIRDDDGGWGEQGKDEGEDIEEAVVEKDRGFKKRRVVAAAEGSGWATIQEGLKAAADSPGPVAEEEIEATQETVYRDASGRKIDTKAERADAARRKREREEKEAQKMEWGKGLVQREEQEQKRLELQRQKTRGFARYADDKDLNEELKAKDRWNDPAAAFLTKKSSKGPRKPEYSGPPPPPNRFGIKPGYRWDGVDRGNGFEKKFFQKSNEKSRRKLESYQWSAEDM